jgi:hypothetical protein
MMKMPELRCRKIYRTYYQYNHSINSDDQNNRGIILLNAVAAQGYIYHNTAALYIVNTSLFVEEAEISIPDEMEGKNLRIIKDFAGPDQTDRAIAQSDAVIDSTGETVKLSLAPLEAVIISTGF